MEKFFNVAFSPWIPVVDLKGQRRLVSLKEVFTEGERLADLQVRPQERVALMRLFTCVAHAALDGPKDLAAWRQVPDRLPGAVRAYLKKWEDAFWLFHPERPWLQVNAIDKGKGPCPADTQETAGWTPVSKLNFSYASGNNSTLFDHGAMSGERVIPLEETILSMLTYQCYSVGGLSSQVYWNGKQTTKTTKASPCIPGSMLHAFLRSDNLLRTIHSNLPNLGQVQEHYGVHDIGRPVWEMMPGGLDDLANVENATRTYVGRLVPLKRLMKLHWNQAFILLGDGLDFPGLGDGFPAEPTATVVEMTKKVGKKEQVTRIYLAYRPGKDVWRELTSLLLKRKNLDDGRCLVLKRLARTEEVDLVVVAVATKKADIVDHIESVFHIPAKLGENDGALAYDEEIRQAETIASRKLSWAIETYRMELDAGWKGKLEAAGSKKGALRNQLSSTATTHFWTRVETHLPLLMTFVDALGTDAAPAAQNAWRQAVRRAAEEAYETVCGKETARQLRAFSLGWGRLVSRIHTESEGQPNEEEEEDDA